MDTFVNPYCLTLGEHLFAKFFNQLGVIAVNALGGYFMQVSCALMEQDMLDNSKQNVQWSASVGLSSCVQHMALVITL